MSIGRGEGDEPGWPADAPTRDRVAATVNDRLDKSHVLALPPLVKSWPSEGLDGI